ncbi:MAG: hypothetical protein AAF531_07490 [Actinomycetota bacterium]
MSTPRCTAAVALLAVITIVAGCSPSGTTRESVEAGVVPSPPLPVASPTVPFDPSESIADHDGSVVVTATAGSVTFRSASGDDVVAVDGGAASELRAVSADGRMAALFERASSATSLITVVDRRSGRAEISSYDLPGVVEPEAFSTDGSLLYVIDHQVAAADGAYRVRPLNLASGRLETIVGPSKVPLIEDMNGVGRRQVWAPDGTRLYTLYIRQTHHHHHHHHEDDHQGTDDHPDRDVTGTAGEPGTDAFVHVLDLAEEWAFCLDLPAEFGAGELETTALALSPDGTTVAVADKNAGQVAVASTEELVVSAVHPLVSVPEAASLHLGLTGHHVAVAGDQTIAWYDRDTMAPIGSTVSSAGPVVGFTPTAEGLLAWTDDLQAAPRLVSPRG